MQANKPLLIVLSCTRNYGWVTRAFLEGNTRWADYIIIVDQMSTDGTREMCAEYGDKVIIVDDPDMTYKESTRAKMAFEKGREIAGERDHIFFALDIDEVMPANWIDTEDGKRILNSKPGDMFQTWWANLLPDNKKYYGCNDKVDGEWQYKIWHSDANIGWFYDTDRELHTPLLPYTSWDNDPYYVMDFPLLHFGRYHIRWVEYKMMYYEMLDCHQGRSTNVVSRMRHYTGGKLIDLEPHVVKDEWLDFGFDLYGLIDLKSMPIFQDYMRKLILEDGLEKYASLSIWTPELCEELKVHNPQKWYFKILLRYIRLTNEKSRCLVIRIIDKILKIIFQCK